VVAVAREFEFLIARAKREGDHKLAKQLERAYMNYMDRVTS
jgi:hypothetical protein